MVRQTELGSDRVNRSSPDLANPSEVSWWRAGVGYEIYLPSFADSDNDGVGDIRGLMSRLDYLVDLGVDMVWISPWYKSPWSDGGYDVQDYFAIDPRFGTMSDAVGLISQLKAKGIKVLLDLVANHTSNRHTWFVEALLSGPGSQARQRYLFRDGRGVSGELPPTDWISAFGGSAWTRTYLPSGEGGQWYLHLFAEEQPDLNWANPEVIEYFDEVFKYWIDLGVDGFRIDAASAFIKDQAFPDGGFHEGDPFKPEQWSSSPFWDREEVSLIMRRWRKLADSYQRKVFLIGEVTVASPKRLSHYIGPSLLDSAFNMEFLACSWSAKEFKAVIDSAVEGTFSAAWVMSSHDVTRAVTRYAMDGDRVDLKLGSRRARALALLMLALPGLAFLYQGEELGLNHVDGLVASRSENVMLADPDGNRLGCRIPLPWVGSEPPYGFCSSGAKPWLEPPSEWANLSVMKQETDPSSFLTLYKLAITLRKQWVIRDGSAFDWIETSDPDVLGFLRGKNFACFVNFSDHDFELPKMVKTMLGSEGFSGGTIATGTAVWAAIGAH